MEPAVRAVLDGLARRDDDAVRLALHPYLHWTFSDGTTVRGRVRVLSRLSASCDVPPEPAEVELRDGQIYRWVS